MKYFRYDSLILYRPYAIALTRSSSNTHLQIHHPTHHTRTQTHTGPPGRQSSPALLSTTTHDQKQAKSTPHGPAWPPGPVTGPHGSKAWPSPPAGRAKPRPPLSELRDRAHTPARIPSDASRFRYRDSNPGRAGESRVC